MKVTYNVQLTADEIRMILRLLMASTESGRYETYHALYSQAENLWENVEPKEKLPTVVVNPNKYNVKDSPEGTVAGYVDVMNPALKYGEGVIFG